MKQVIEHVSSISSNIYAKLYDQLYAKHHYTDKQIDHIKTATALVDLSILVSDIRHAYGIKRIDF